MRRRQLTQKGLRASAATSPQLPRTPLAHHSPGDRPGGDLVSVCCLGIRGASLNPSARIGGAIKQRPILRCSTRTAARGDVTLRYKMVDYCNLA